MKEQMSLENYKNKVKDYLKNYKVRNELIYSWMKTYDKDILDAYNNHWKVEELAIPMILGY